MICCECKYNITKNNNDMPFTDNILIVRHRLLRELVRLWKQDELVEKIDRLPMNLSPRRSKHAGRCCVHKERAIWKYKSLPLMGLDMDDEKDELTSLSEYASMAMVRSSEKETKENIMCIIDEACSSCVQINYYITDLCRGCSARVCQTQCPKKAIHVYKDSAKAWIDTDSCVSCGICQTSCPYHAIVYVPVPCEEACPVKAIKKDEFGVERIDEDLCIYCGKCLNACPFGAIFEISQVFDILNDIKSGQEVVAILAPSILGQYTASPEQVYGAIKEIGFTDVIEVAHGAMSTVTHEAAELLHKMDQGQAFMTTSCCPAYTELVSKHMPKMKDFVSDTKSPMYYTARIAKEKHPNAKIVFIGPCTAKRKEAKSDDAVDYVMTFEEVDSVLDGLEINTATAAPHDIDFKSVREAHAFGQAGGVAAAVKAYLKEKANGISIAPVSNLNKKNINLLNAYSKSGKAPAQFLEVMSCEGGCISGPCTHRETRKGKPLFVKAVAKQESTYEDMD